MENADACGHGHGHGHGHGRLMLIRSTFVNILGVAASTQYIVYAVQLCTALTVQLCSWITHTHHQCLAVPTFLTTALALITEYIYIYIH